MTGPGSSPTPRRRARWVPLRFSTGSTGNGNGRPRPKPQVAAAAGHLTGRFGRLPPAVRVALAAWLEARLYVAAAYIVVRAVVGRIEPPPAFTPVSDGLLAWDGRWYQAIAMGGYSGAEDPALRFFPLWPLVGRFLGWLPGVGPGVAMVIAANVLALVAGVLLYRLVMSHRADHALARRAVRLLALAPPSFVLVLAYSEALYLCLAMATFTFAGRNRWWATAVTGYLAGLTRPVGVLLAPAVGTVVFTGEARQRPAAWVATAAPVAGAATFGVWAWRALGDATAPIDRQRELRGDLPEPVSRLVTAGWRGVRGDEGELFHFLAGVIVVTLAVTAVRKLPAPQAVYAVTSAVVLLAAENLNSVERYALSAFPLVIAGAVLSRHRFLDRHFVSISAVAMVSVSVLAFHGVYVP